MKLKSWIVITLEMNKKNHPTTAST